jgi:putative spermidine/putrescine transport system permease protein
MARAERRRGPRQESLADRSYRLVMGGLTAVALVILVGPVVVVLVTSFTDSLSLKFPPPGLSTRWYRVLFDPRQSAEIHSAAATSLLVAAVATAFATVLGTLAALAIARSRAGWARGLDVLFMSPIILPALAYGLSALAFFTLLGFRLSIQFLVIGHIVVIAPFVLRTTVASLSQLDPALLDSSASLGASALYTFRRVTLPIILPGIAAGAFLAFMASFDNVPVSLFLADARTEVLPIRMWHMLEATLDVRTAAISGVLIGATLLLLLVMDRVVGLARRMR